MTKLSCQFDFHDIIFHVSLVTLTIDGVTPILQLMGIKNINKNMGFSPNKSLRNSKALFKMAELL